MNIFDFLICQQNVVQMKNDKKKTFLLCNIYDDDDNFFLMDIQVDYAKLLSMMPLKQNSVNMNA